MAFDIHFASTVRNVPDGVRAALIDLLADIARTAETVPAASNFWHSVRESQLRIDFTGWRFGYTIDDRRKRIEVLYAVPLFTSAASGQKK